MNDTTIENGVTIDIKLLNCLNDHGFSFEPTGNNVSPSYYNEELNLSVWINWDSLSQRENHKDYSFKYLISEFEPRTTDLFLFSSDSPAETIGFIKGFEIGGKK